MTRIRFHHILGLLLMCWLAVSCSPDAPSVPIPEAQRMVEARLNLGIDNGAVTGEQMKSWLVVAVKDGTIVDLVESEDYEGEKSQDAALAKIPEGTITFYSFANISKQALGLDQLQVGDALPADFDERTYTMNGNQAYFADHFADLVGNYPQGIPMSNKQTVEITASTREINLEVIRLLAKVELQLKNTTSHSITLKSLTLTDVTPNESDNLLLLPGASDSEGKQVVETHLHTQQKEIMRLQSLSEYVIDAGNTQNICFYMNESEATTASKYFVLQLQTQDNDNTSTKVNRRLAMLDWQKICRNDYRIIPITLDDYAIEWKVEAFTPIGVLPEVEDNGETLTVTFGYYGEFHIVPTVRQISTGYYSQILNGSFTKTEGDENIFESDGQPTWSAAGKRIEGKLANTSGSAFYTLRLDARRQDSNETITLSRKVRIVMKQVDFNHK